MPSTGLFNIVLAKAGKAEGSRVGIKVDEVTAQCLTCDGTLSAKPGAGLEAVEGGVVIVCTACGVRQAVSNQLFAAVIRGA